MSEIQSSPCACGQPIALPESGEAGTHIEVVCGCGRRHDFERRKDAWVFQCVLVPEGSVPVDGFSRELRLQPDTGRFRFETRDALGRRIPVHIVFSPSRALAEAKSGDLKPLRMSKVQTATEARRRWLDWRKIGGSPVFPREKHE